MNSLIVRLWGEELGRLAWDSSSGSTYFTFNPDAYDRPDVAPLTNPKDKWRKEVPVFGDARRIYQGLPPFIADSLPDSWGNKLFEQWVRQNKIPRRKVNPLFKLMFIGRRGMGALEFEPAAQELEHRRSVDIKELYTLSLDILKERESVVLDATGELTMQALLAVGTSAGGRQMKAIVAFDPETEELRSGQANAPSGFDHYIIKFEDELVPTTEIEMAYHDMATECGIDMEYCRAIEVEGISHFMTRRFDRKNGGKIHMQTLAAINPEADSYEDLMATCRTLGLSQKDMIEVYRRLVFNVMANNTDDHNKNFSFLLEKGGKWRLSPAYDVTFIFNRYGTGPETSHVFSLYGKTSDITREDLMDFAKEHSIRDAESIIANTGNALSRFAEVAEKYKIPARWSHMIQKTILENLSQFGFMEIPEAISEFTDTCGREFRHLSINANTKGYYHISVQIDDQPHKRIIRPSNDNFKKIQEFELGNLKDTELIVLMEDLFSRD